MAVAKLLVGIVGDQRYVGDVTLCDSQGAISKERSNLPPAKLKALEWSNSDNRSGTLQDVLKGADIFIGVSKPDLLTADDIRTMNKDPIVFAMSNPNPEIRPEEAKAGGAAIIATGRSDYPNQVNNVLVFPGLFRGALDAHAKRITAKMYTAAAHALAGVVTDPTPDRIIPDRVRF